MPSWIVSAGGVVTIMAGSYGLYVTLAWLFAKFTSALINKSSAVALFLVSMLATAAIYWWLQNNTAPSETFAFRRDANIELITHHKFSNEVVVLDGFEYSDCDFTNVTFKYNGTTSIKFHDSQIHGPFRIRTENPTVTGTAVLFIGLGMISPDIPLVSGPEDKPVRGIEPPKKRD